MEVERGMSKTVVTSLRSGLTSTSSLSSSSSRSPSWDRFIASFKEHSQESVI